MNVTFSFKTVQITDDCIYIFSHKLSQIIFLIYVFISHNILYNIFFKQFFNRLLYINILIYTYM